jgi:hypothetical protein
VRHRWLGTAAALAFVACVLAFVPLVLRDHRAAARPVLAPATTVVTAVHAGERPPHVVLRLHGQFGFPAGAPDGSLLLVQASAGGRSAIWRFAHGHGRRIGSLPAGAVPVWSPDRSRVAVWEPPGRVVIRRLDGARVRTLTAQLGIGGIACSSWAGRYIACLRTSRSASGWRLAAELWRDDGVLVRRRRLSLPFGAAPALASADGRLVVRRSSAAPGDVGRSADGRTVYVARVKLATSMPK